MTTFCENSAGVYSVLLIGIKIPRPREKCMQKRNILGIVNIPKPISSTTKY